MTDTRVTSLRGDVLYETDLETQLRVTAVRAEVAYLADTEKSVRVTSANVEVLHKWSYTTPAPALHPIVETRVTSLRGDVLYETDHVADVFVYSSRAEVAYVSDIVSDNRVTSTSVEVLYKWSFTTTAPALNVVGTLVTQQYVDVLASSQAQGFVGIADYLDINFKGISPGTSITQKQLVYEKKKNSIHRTRTNKDEEI